MEKDIECGHPLNSLRKFRKKEASQTAHAQTVVTAPPSGPSEKRSILDFTSESYLSQNQQPAAPSTGKNKDEKTIKLHKLTDQLVSKKTQEEFKSNVSTNTILEKTPHSFPEPRPQNDLKPSDFSIENILKGTPQNNDQELSDSSENTFEMIRNPYSMKKVASNSAEFCHLGVNEKQNGKNFTNTIHYTYSSDPNDPNGEKIKSFIKLENNKMGLNLQPLKRTKCFETLIEKQNSQLTIKNEKENYIISTKKEMGNVKRNNDSKHFQLDNISKIQNEDLSQKFQIGRILNWQHDNNINRSSSPHTKEKPTNVESSKGDKSPTLLNILHEGANYKNNLIHKPWDTKDILIKRKQTFNQTTHDKIPISFSPCNLDGNPGILHGQTKTQETEIIKPTQNKVYNQENNPTYSLLTLSVHQAQQERDNINTSRYFNFRYGQHPYSAIFKSFAPSSTPKTAMGRAIQAASGATDRGMGASARAARNILSRIAQEPPIGAQHMNSQCVPTKQTAPDIIPPWRPKPRAARPIPSQEQPPTLQPWYATGRDEVDSTRGGTAGENSAETAQSTDHLKTLDMSQLDDLHDDIRMNVDKQIDRLHEFNDSVLLINGFHMVPYSTIQNDCPPDIYAGSCAAELTQGLFLYVCKPCDMAGFLKSNFKLHHNSEKHLLNVLIWIRQHYFLPEAHQHQICQPTKEASPTERHCQPSLQESDTLQEFNDIMKQIKTKYFPEKYKHEVAGLITEFFLSQNDLNVNFTTDFTNSRDSHGDRHWIVLAVEQIQQKTNPRQFMKDMFQQKLEIFTKSMIQATEVIYISDLARLLFLLFIDCSFIPTEYVTMLATIMNPVPNMQYPESNAGLFNGHLLDLLLNMGAMRLSYNDIQTQTNQNNLTQLLNDTNIGVEKSNHSLKPGNQNIETQINKIKKILSKSVILKEPLSKDNIDPEWSIANVDSNQAWNGMKCHKKSHMTRGSSQSTSSSYSIPSLGKTRPNNGNQQTLSPRPSTSNSINNSPQETHFLKSQYRKNAIYINNLTPGLNQEDLIKMCKEFGPIKKVIKAKNFKTNAVVVFANKSSAKLALKKLNNALSSQIVPGGMLGTRLTVQYALKKGPTRKEFSSYSIPSLNPPKPPVPPKTKAIDYGLQEFNASGILICSTENVTIPTYSNKEIKVKLFDKRFPNTIIPNAKVFISCGLAPQIQLSDGIFNVTDSTTKVSIRNSLNVPMDIKINQVIRGTNCHLRGYVNNQTITKEVCLSEYHLKCKTYKRINQFDDSNHDTKESKLWMMEDNTE